MQLESNEARHRTMRCLVGSALGIGLIMWIPLGCGPGDAERSEVPVESSIGALYSGAGVTLWGSGAEIPVCWTDSGFVSEKFMIREALRNTWEAQGNLHFRGFELCPTVGTEQFVRVWVNRGTDAWGGGSSRMGRAALQVPNSDITVRSTHIALPQNEHSGRIEYLAVHEFGHVLGFGHETDRPDNQAPEGPCNPPGAAPGTAFTPYDRESIMDDCNSGGNISGRLSSGDVNGVVAAYGRAEPQLDLAIAESRPDGGSAVASSGGQSQTFALQSKTGFLNVLAIAEDRGSGVQGLGVLCGQVSTVCADGVCSTTGPSEMAAPCLETRSPTQPPAPSRTIINALNLADLLPQSAPDPGTSRTVELRFRARATNGRSVVGNTPTITATWQEAAPPPCLATCVRNCSRGCPSGRQRPACVAECRADCAEICD